MTDGRRQLQPGDLIEIFRPLHHHWALYVGNEDVIHLTPVDKQKETLGIHKVPLFTRRVKKERLEKVVGNDKWRVNNKSDQSHTPLPVKDMLSRAAAYTGREMKCRSFGSNCEDFVKKLRYEDQWRAFVGGEMDILDMRDDEEYPKPGDLIEIKQEYNDHWALYVGNRYVIHMTLVDEGAPSLSGSSDTRLMRKAKVKKELLEEVVGNGDRAVNNEYDCHCTPLPVEEIIQCAKGCIGEEMTYETYDVFKLESHNFVTKLRYGDQLRAFVGGEMGILDMRDDEEYPKPGDLIEIKQEYNDHWALYVGNGFVIHMTDVDEGAPSLSGSSGTRHMRKAKVKKELLMDVVRNNNWRVSKEYDCHRPPLPVEEIIWHAEGGVGKEVTYDVLKFKSVDFLSKLRHVGLWRAFEGGEIRRHDPINREYLPIPGDLIEIKQRGYQHWALCMGRGYVIHVTDVGSTDVSSGSVSSSHGRAMVKKELLMQVFENRCWCVNNKYDQDRKPFPLKEIIRRAESKINNPVPYHLLEKNCEHFVTKLRYGEAFSDQVMTTLGFINMALSAGTATGLICLFTVPTVPILAIVGAGSVVGYNFLSNRIAHNRICANFRRPGRDILERRCC